MREHPDNDQNNTPPDALSGRATVARHGTGHDPVILPRDVAAGMFLIGLGAMAAWQASGLDLGSSSQMGPGMLPFSLAIVTTLFGVALVVRSLLGARSAKMERLRLRGPVLIGAAALVFALTIRPLGFVIAAPAALLLAVAADRETRWTRIGVFVVSITAFCVLLFRVLLGLPIPMAPWWLGY